MITGWLMFREQYPEQARQVKDLGSELYELGAEGAQKDERLDQLQALIRELPQDALKRIELTQQSSREEILTVVFKFGAQLIYQLERGG